MKYNDSLQTGHSSILKILFSEFFAVELAKFEIISNIHICTAILAIIECRYVRERLDRQSIATSSLLTTRNRIIKSKTNKNLILNFNVNIWIAISS